MDTGAADVRLLDGVGADITAAIPGSGSGECVATVQLVSTSGEVLDSFDRNEWGTFFRVYQPNKWRAKRDAAAAERETIMA